MEEVGSQKKESPCREKNSTRLEKETRDRINKKKRIKEWIKDC
jgi:hypothetical protein